MNNEKVNLHFEGKPVSPALRTELVRRERARTFGRRARKLLIIIPMLLMLLIFTSHIESLYLPRGTNYPHLGDSDFDYHTMYRQYVKIEYYNYVNGTRLNPYPHGSGRYIVALKMNDINRLYDQATESELDEFTPFFNFEEYCSYVNGCTIDLTDEKIDSFTNLRRFIFVWTAPYMPLVRNAAIAALAVYLLLMPFSRKVRELQRQELVYCEGEFCTENKVDEYALGAARRYGAPAHLGHRGSLVLITSYSGKVNVKGFDDSRRFSLNSGIVTAKGCDGSRRFSLNSRYLTKDENHAMRAECVPVLLVRRKDDESSKDISIYPLMDE